MFYGVEIMAFTPLLFTGWENGNLVGDYYNTWTKYGTPCASVVGTAKTGNYGLRCAASDEYALTFATFSNFTPRLQSGG